MIAISLPPSEEGKTAKEHGMLYPKSNKHRDVYNLNGVWNYKTVENDYVPYEKATGTALMAVPASCNDIVTDKAVKD